MTYKGPTLSRPLNLRGGRGRLRRHCLGGHPPRSRSAMRPRQHPPFGAGLVSSAGNESGPLFARAGAGHGGGERHTETPCDGSLSTSLWRKRRVRTGGYGAHFYVARADALRPTRARIATAPEAAFGIESTVPGAAHQGAALEKSLCFTRGGRRCVLQKSSWLWSHGCETSKENFVADGSPIARAWSRTWPRGMRRPCRDLSRLKDLQTVEDRQPVPTSASSAREARTPVRASSRSSLRELGHDSTGVVRSRSPIRLATYECRGRACLRRVAARRA